MENTKSKMSFKEIILTALESGPKFEDELRQLLSNPSAVNNTYQKLVISGIEVKRIRYLTEKKITETIYYLVGMENLVKERIEVTEYRKPGVYYSKKLYNALNFHKTI